MDTEGDDMARPLTELIDTQHADMEHLKHDTNLVPRSGTINLRGHFPEKNTALSMPGSRGRLPEIKILELSGNPLADKVLLLKI